jgi:hypothetical protein
MLVGASMFYSPLLREPIKETQLGLGVCVRYGPDEFEELLHVLRFVDSCVKKHQLTDDLMIPSFHVDGEEVDRVGLLEACERSDIEDIEFEFEEITVWFRYAHQLIFNEYRAQVAREKKENWYAIERIYQQAGKEHFPVMTQAN